MIASTKNIKWEYLKIKATLIFLFICFIFSGIELYKYKTGFSYHCDSSSKNHIFNNEGVCVSKGDELKHLESDKLFSNILFNTSNLNNSKSSSLDIKQTGNILSVNKSKSEFSAVIQRCAIAFLFFMGLYLLVKSYSNSSSVLARKNNSKNIKYYDILVLVFFILVSYFKIGIIDVLALGHTQSLIDANMNPYVISMIQGMAGSLPVFPYNPLFLGFLSFLNEIHNIINTIFFKQANYSVLQVALILAYYFLVHELTMLVHNSGLVKCSKKKVFYFILLNPLGIYYTMFLGQIDVFSIAFFVAGIRKIFQTEAPAYGWLMCYIAIVFAKPQHLLLLPILYFGLLGQKDIFLKSYLKHLIWLSVGVAVTYKLYSFFPGFAESLANNPQSLRLSWSTWYSFFDGAAEINRPIAFLLMVGILSVFLFPTQNEQKVYPISLALLVGSFYSAFQSSFAHTFGLAIFLLPAIVILSLSCGDNLKSVLISLLSLCLLATWGTGLAGDVTNSIGFNFFNSEIISSVKFYGIKYPTILTSIEFSSYIAFTVCFLYLLTRPIGSFQEKK